MTKIVYNGCYGGFSLSKAAVVWLANHGHAGAQKEVRENEAAVAGDRSHCDGTINPDFWHQRKVENWTKGDTGRTLSYSWHPWKDDDLPRSHPLLVQCVEELGEKANGACAQLEVAEVLAGTKYRIDEYDGNERVMTVDDYEWEIA